jgi:hypothetical protein
MWEIIYEPKPKLAETSHRKMVRLFNQETEKKKKKKGILTLIKTLQPL